MLARDLLLMQADEAEEQSVELGDQVTFCRVIYCRSGAVWAHELQVICKAANRRELGQVSLVCFLAFMVPGVSAVLVSRLQGTWWCLLHSCIWQAYTAWLWEAEGWSTTTCMVLASRQA